MRKPVVLAPCLSLRKTPLEFRMYSLAALTSRWIIIRGRVSLGKKRKRLPCCREVVTLREGPPTTAPACLQMELSGLAEMHGIRLVLSKAMPPQIDMR